MAKNISFKFEFETEEVHIAHHFLPRILDRVKRLQHQHKQLKNIEITLMKSAAPPVGKTAVLTAHLPEGVVREESSVPDWGEAIDIVFQHLEESMTNCLKVD